MSGRPERSHGGERFRLAAGAVGLSLVGLAASAGGADRLTPIRVTLLGPFDCPTEAGLARAILARTKNGRLATGTEAARTFAVTVIAEPGRAVGHLSLGAGSPSSGAREVVGSTCAEVVDALALTAALAIDTEAEEAQRPPAPAPASSPSSMPPATGAPAATPPIAAPPPPASGAPAAAALARSAAPDLPRAAPATPSAGWAWALALDASAVLEIAPEATFALEPRLELARRGSGWLRPSFGLGFWAASSGRLSAHSGEAELSWAVARLEGCPVALPSGPIAFRACALFDAGLLHAAGSKIEGARDADRPWVAPGLRLRAGWERSGLFAEAQLAASFPLVRDEFYFEPSTTIYRAPAAGVMAGGGAGFRFP